MVILSKNKKILDKYVQKIRKHFRYVHVEYDKRLQILQNSCLSHLLTAVSQILFGTYGLPTFASCCLSSYAIKTFAR